jgi:hypothetical protein
MFIEPEMSSANTFAINISSLRDDAVCHCSLPTAFCCLMHPRLRSGLCLLLSAYCLLIPAASASALFIACQNRGVPIAVKRAP